MIPAALSAWCKRHWRSSRRFSEDREQNRHKNKQHPSLER